MDKYKPTESEIAAFIIRHDLHGSIAEAGTLIDDARSMHLLRSNPVPEQPAPDAVKVVFRAYRKAPHEVVALFPEVPADVSGVYLTVYEHVGQHGSGGQLVMNRLTNPAQPEQYAELKRELEGIGYVLDVHPAATNAMQKVRREAARKARQS